MASSVTAVLPIDPAQAVEQNLRRALSLMASNSPAGEVRDIGGVTIASCGSSMAMFNAALLAEPIGRPPDSLGLRLSTASVHYGARRLPWSFWAGEALLGNRMKRAAPAIFQEAGLVHTSSLPGMYCLALRPASRAIPELHIERVNSAAAIRDFCHVSSICFHTGLPDLEDIFGAERGWRGQLLGFVAYCKGEAVATLTAVAADGVLGLYNVGTMPAWRRHGFAEAMMRRAVLEFPGLPLVLQSTESGLNLYRRLGFRTVTNVRVYRAPAHRVTTG